MNPEPLKRRARAIRANPDMVHVVFKTHLDIGFTDFARRVVKGYFDRYIPRALELARELRECGGENRFIWTTGSWLLYEYLQFAGRSERRALEAGIAAGDIAWHALPFTTHTELLDSGLFRAGLSLSKELDAQFGKQTVAGKMTDVPGHTRAMIPLLAEAGVEFLHIGVNPASRPPAVPPLFVWRHDDGSEVVVMYGVGYGASAGVSGLTAALRIAHTGDNAGPQTPRAVVETLERMRREYPGARVRASTLDAFAVNLRAIRHQLPVVTGEIGDTWIHGVGTDPRKVARFRALCRWRRTQPDSPALRRFSRALLLIAEHTWGLDVKTHLKDFAHYARTDFERVRHGEFHSRYARMERSWAEQRAYLANAVRCLPESRTVYRGLTPRRPVTTRWQTAGKMEAELEFPGFIVHVDPASGALVRLRETTTGQEWAGPAHPLGWFSYQTFSQADYDRYLRTYNINLDKPECRAWAIPDFSKPGMASAGAPSRFWHFRLHRAWRKIDRLLLELAGPAAAVRRWGCPACLTIEIRFPELQWTVQWFGKPANRLPEACWFSFVPRVGPDVRMWMDKMGQWISPLDVVRDGNRNLHAVQRGVRVETGGRRFYLESLDAPLVAPGLPRLLRFDNSQPDLQHGLHVNLYNNIWGTNFPMWNEGNARFRFGLRRSTP